MRFRVPLRLIRSSPHHLIQHEWLLAPEEHGSREPGPVETRAAHFSTDAAKWCKK